MAYLPFRSGYLRGVEIIDQTSFTYTNKAQSFLWSNRGFKMHFPANASPPEVNQCRIHVKVSLFGQFHFPKNTELISGQYWIATRHIFIKPVTVEIQHCALDDPQQQSPLTYIVAKRSAEELSYQFKTLEGGVFSPSSRYGSINLTHFSGLHGNSFLTTFSSFADFTQSPLHSKKLLLPTLLLQLGNLLCNHVGLGPA